MLLWTWVYKHLFKTLLSVLLGPLPRSGIAGSDDNSIFSFWGSLLIVFHSSCTILHPHQHCTRVPISPLPRQLTVFWVFKDCSIVATLMDVRLYLTAALICISLMIGDVEHFSMCLLPCVYHWRNVYSSPLPIVWIRLFVSLLLSIVPQLCKCIASII